VDNFLVKLLANAASDLDAAAEHASEIGEREMWKRCCDARAVVEQVLKAEVNHENLPREIEDEDI